MPLVSLMDRLRSSRLRQESDYLVVIPEYNIPKQLAEVLKTNLNPNLNTSPIAEAWIIFLKNLSKYSCKNICDFKVLKRLLHCEEYYGKNNLNINIPMKRIVKLQPTQYEKNFKIKLKGLNQELCFLKSDYMLKVVSDNSLTYLLKITEVDPPWITVLATSVFLAQHWEDNVYSVEFYYSSWPIRVCHFAVDAMEKHDLLFKMQLDIKTRNSNKKKTTNLIWFDKNIEKNAEQMQAVQQIVGRTSYPSPYIIFGPPGTGKTATIIEAISQLTLSYNNILICTPSNAAANEIAKRLLLNKIPTKSICRLISRTASLDGLDEMVEQCIPLSSREVGYVSNREIFKKQIIITTLVYSARLVRAIGYCNYFDYIFIDEAGQATMPETFIPCVLFKSNDCQIVMSGDPKQLRPVVKTKYGYNILGQSLLERLMERSEVYQRDERGKYDSTFITKLVKNYRSHEAILEFPNKMFYDSELVVCGGKKIKRAEDWPYLPRKKFPIVFHAAYGSEIKFKRSHSVANEHEALIVMSYVHMLLGRRLGGLTVTESDIGIITPFVKQRNLIENILSKKRLDGITVGTVESYQGQERDIIIVSTVRSRVFRNGDMSHIGFLSDEKRLNVTITRAKCLLIVIGNPEVLEVDKCWRQFIFHCRFAPISNIEDLLSKMNLKG